MSFLFSSSQPAAAGSPAPASAPSSDRKLVLRRLPFRPPTSLLPPSKKLSKNGKRKPRSAANSLTVSQPPATNITPTFRHRYRFISSGAGTFQCTLKTIAGALGGIGTVANTTVTCWASGFRIRRVEVWSPAGSGTDDQASVEFTYKSTGAVLPFDDRDMNQVVLGTSQPTHISVRPPPNTLQDRWFPCDAASIAIQNPAVITITAGSDTVVDLIVDQTNFNMNAGGPSTWAPAVAFLGTIYYGRLDGVGGKLIPVDLPTTN